VEDVLALDAAHAKLHDLDEGVLLHVVDAQPREGDLPGFLGIMIALMCGFFLYIGASDLLPESHHAHPKRLTTVMNLAGIVTLYAVIRIAG